jgi:hypothetical protein
MEAKFFLSFPFNFFLKELLLKMLLERKMLPLPLNLAYLSMFGIKL